MNNETANARYATGDRMITTGLSMFWFGIVLVVFSIFILTKWC